MSRRKGLYPDGYKRVTAAMKAWYEEIRVRQAKQNAEARGRGRADPAGASGRPGRPGRGVSKPAGANESVAVEERNRIRAEEREADGCTSS